MEEIVDEVVSSDTLKKLEAVYNKQVEDNAVTKGATFDYASCLIRSRYAADIRKGICLLETLFQDGSEEEKRDYIYFLALGHTKLKEYTKALKYCRSFLSIEPGNQQVQNLERLVISRMEKEGLFGLAIASGAILAIGGLVTLAVKLAKK